MNRNEQDIHSLLYQCEQALLTLYNNKLSDNRQQAHQWLLDTQKSQQAWQLCWKLMDKEKAAEVQFFGASMLHFKISRYWLELPEEQYEPLRSEIFKHILAFCGGPKIVLTRLCVALGAFVLHTMPDHWENATSDIIAALHSVTPNQEGVKYNALLELLTVLPEEFMTAELKAGKRMTLRDGLNKAIPHEDFQNIVLDGSSAVLQITQAEITSASSSAQEKLQALRCLNSWVQFGISLFDLDFLLPVLFEAISKTELFDACVDLLVEVISHPTSHKYPNSVWKFAANLAQLHSLLRSSLESSDMDVVCGLCRILVSLGETHTKILLFPDTNERQLISMETVQAILECTNANGWYPVDEQCSEMTLNFWYTLQDDIYSQDAAVQLQLRSAYEPVFNALCQVFLRKVQYPTESEWNGYSSDEKEQFRYYRQDVSDTMMYIYCVTGPLLLQQLHGTLSSLLSGESPPVWQSVEATLYLVQSVSENVEPEEEVFLPAILSLLPKLPSHPKVSQTALVMVGSYSEWLNCHIEQLRSVLPVLLSGLTQEHLASASTQALRGICEECVQDLDQDILQEILSHCQVALTGSVIKDRERLRCMECIGYALSVQPHSLVMEKLQNAVGPYLQLLSQIVTPQPSKELKPRLQFTLKIFAVLFKCLVPSSLAPNHSHPAAPVLKEVMTSLKSLNSWIRDNDIAQDVCLCLERAIDTIRDHMGPLVPEIAQLIIDFFSVLPQSCLLDTATMFVGMYGGEGPHMATVALTFQGLSNIVLQLLQTNLQEHPDILQSYMQFAARAIKTNSQLVFGGDGMAAHIFQCGLTAIALSDSHCVRAACNFLVVFINTYETQETTKQILHAYGQHLVGQVITGIGGGVPRQCTDFLAEILLTLNKRCVELLSKWMQAVLEVQGFPSTLVTPAQKQQFTSSVLRGRAQKSRLKEAVKEFSLLCRGLYGFPYTNT